MYRRRRPFHPARLHALLTQHFLLREVPWQDGDEEDEDDDSDGSEADSDDASEEGMLLLRRPAGWHHFGCAVHCNCCTCACHCAPSRHCVRASIWRET